MRQGSLSVLVTLCLLAPTLQAQEPDTQTATDRQAEPKQSVSDNPQPRPALTNQPDTGSSRAEAVQLTRLLEENQRLKMQLRQQQENPVPELLNEQQRWFAVGGGVGVLGFLFGVLTTRGRRRRQWLN